MLPHDDAAESIESARALAQRALGLIAELREIESELKRYLGTSGVSSDADLSEVQRASATAIAYKGPMRWARG